MLKFEGFGGRLVEIWGRLAVFVGICGEEQSLRFFGLEAVALGELWWVAVFARLLRYSKMMLGI